MSERAAGILMPISSLPSEYGIGCFSKSAYEFVDWLKKAGQSYWQILPLGPTSYGDSPYQSFSTFAGNPYFISLEALVEEGCCFPKAIRTIDRFHIQQMAFEAVQELRIAHRSLVPLFPDANLPPTTMMPSAIAEPLFPSSGHKFVPVKTSIDRRFYRDRNRCPGTQFRPIFENRDKPIFKVHIPRQAESAEYRQSRDRHVVPVRT